MARQLRGKDPKSVKPRKAKVLVFGKAGVGKTWVSLDFPRVYYMDIEGGATREHYTDKLRASQAAYFGPDDGSHDYDTVIEEVVSLATVKHDYRTLVIDSFTKLYNIARYKAEEKGGSEFARDKREANRPTRRLVDWLHRLDMNVILISHEVDKWANSEVVGQTFDGYEKLDYELDLVLQVQRRGEGRNVAIVRKSRLEGFPSLATFTWSYDEFAERYGKDVMEAEADAIEIATDEQVKRIHALLEVVKIPADMIERWLSKAGCSDFAEMDTTTIQKCIDHLEQRTASAA